MRGNEQHVERKIRLWVVQQERNRLREVRPERLDARAAERTEQPRADADAQTRERWRLP
jgi:hypothetical protein